MRSRSGKGNRGDGWGCGGGRKKRLGLGFREKGIPAGIDRSRRRKWRVLSNERLRASVRGGWRTRVSVLTLASGSLDFLKGLFFEWAVNRNG